MEFNEKQFLEDLRELMQIESVSRKDVTSDAPLGEGVKKALEKMVELGNRYGFKTKLCDGYYGYIEMGEGEQLLGILNHLDTVAVDDGWSCNPFDLTKKGDYLYGRGICDNKGPAVVSLYAMRYLKDNNIKLNKRVRLIFGADEESGGWLGLKKYKETEEIPTFSFSPDSDYPVTFAEKGIFHFELTAPNPNKEFNFFGGKLINMVPAYANAIVGGKSYEAKGVASHAMVPHKGVNAIVELVNKLELEGINHPFIDIIKICNQKDLRIDFSDEASGSLTINPAIANVDNQTISLKCDVRYPVTYKKDEILNPIKNAVEKLGFKLNIMHLLEPLYVEKNSQLVTTLQKVYKEVTNLDTEPVSSGGGTYARAFKNAVAFGIFFPGEENMCHKTDEFWRLSSIKKNYEIIIKAIEEL